MSADGNEYGSALSRQYMEDVQTAYDSPDSQPTYTDPNSSDSGLYIQCESTPPGDLWQFFQNGWEFFNQTLYVYYAFLSTLDYEFLFIQLSATLTKLCHIKRRGVTRPPFKRKQPFPIPSPLASILLSADTLPPHHSLSFPFPSLQAPPLSFPLPLEVGP